jgi:hypothetical protein
VHHGIFRRVPCANRLVMRVNLLLLMAVAFLPFPTKLVAEAIRDTSAERAAVIRHWRRRTPITDTGLARMLPSVLGFLIRPLRSARRT